MSKQPTQPVNPFLTDEFARVYEEAGERITGQASRAALEHVGNIGPGKHVLDIGAGTGALAIPAIEMGAKVTAIDISPGMIRRLSGKIDRHLEVEALVMDGTQMDFSAGVFDATFSVFGVILFRNWREGLREQYRVTRPGGKGCVVTWGDGLGGGPFQIMAAAIESALPERPEVPKPDNFAYFSKAHNLIAEMEAAGFRDVSVKEIECYWEGPTGKDYLEQMSALHKYMPPYGVLSSEDKLRVDQQVLRLSQSRASDGRLRLPSTVLIGLGEKADAKLNVISEL